MPAFVSFSALDRKLRALDPDGDSTARLVDCIIPDGDGAASARRALDRTLEIGHAALLLDGLDEVADPDAHPRLRVDRGRAEDSHSPAS